jgi:hypothetical protein
VAGQQAHKLLPGVPGGAGDGDFYLLRGGAPPPPPAAADAIIWLDAPTCRIFIHLLYFLYIQIAV